MILNNWVIKNFDAIVSLILLFILINIKKYVRKKLDCLFTVIDKIIREPSTFQYGLFVNNLHSKTLISRRLRILLSK